MDDAERRFRDCVDRFKRDLTTIIFQSIDSMVAEAEQRAADEARSSLADGSSTGAAKLPAKAKAARGKHKKGAPETREARAKGARRSDDADGSQLGFEFELASVLPVTRAKPARVREDSILGAELAHGLDVTAGVVATDPAGGGAATNGNSVHGDASHGDGPSVVGAAPAARFRPSSKPPSERPLFVHRRARDGQIHALRRIRDAAPGAAEVNANPPDPGR